MNFNIGSDTSLTIVVNGATLVHKIITSFEAKQKSADLASVAIDGVNRFRYLEQGWDLSFDYDRADSRLDDFFAAKEAGRYAGFAAPAITITETTVDPNTGVPAKYRYEGVTLKLETAGAREGDKKVEEKVTGMASRRIKAL
jgi:hypothetical protein